MDLNTILLFIVSSIVLTLSPGPDILFVISTTISQGLRCGIKVSLGLCFGLIAHTFLVVIGLAKLIETFPFIIRAIELVGASYLIFLAIRLFLSLKENSIINSKNQAKKQFFITGLIMNLSNPKVSLFFLSFFPGFLFSSLIPYNIQFLILGMIFMSQAVIIFLFVAFLANYLGNSLKVVVANQGWTIMQMIVLIFISVIIIYP
tara:strand:- start:647 stop:1258 length:612 start_codon:yes stop_codon:yes gene_type:complete